MKDLNFELLTLCRRNRDGSFGTQHARSKKLQNFATELHQLGYHHMHLKSLKDKHVVALVELWQSRGISPRSMANNMSHLRWWAEKAGRSHVIRRSNREYGIVVGPSIQKNKAQFFSEGQFLLITDPYIQTSIRLQQAFGLRREESMKFQPKYADQGNHIRLKGSWTKGGRPRTIPVIEEGQRELLEQVFILAGSGSLIPIDRSYKQQMARYTHLTQRAGFRNLHGLRHGYAQRRYASLTGWLPPSAGGPKFQELTSAQQTKDLESRLIVSRELGHNRIGITKVYLG